MFAVFQDNSYAKEEYFGVEFLLKIVMTIIDDSAKKKKRKKERTQLMVLHRHGLGGSSHT